MNCVHSIWICATDTKLTCTLEGRVPVAITDISTGSVVDQPTDLIGVTRRGSG